MSSGEMRIDYVSIDEVQRWPRNPKLHSAEELDDSVKRFGYVAPMVMDEKSGRLVAGHGRLEALQRLRKQGLPAPKRVRVDGDRWLVPVVRGVEFADDREAEAYLLADNRLVEMGGWDEAQLKAIMADFEQTADAIRGIGWSGDQVSEMLKSVGVDWSVGGSPVSDPDVEPQIDQAAELNKKWGVKAGDMWCIGGHMLLCGNATNGADVDRVMVGEEKASTIVFTSPPYNAGVSAQLRGNTSIGSNLYRDHYDDNKTHDDWRRLINDALDHALRVSSYVFMNIQMLAGNKKPLILWLADWVDSFADIAIWDKLHAAPQQAQRVMDSRFEFVFVFSENASRAIGTRDFRGCVHNVYVGGPQRNNEIATSHAATMPIDLPTHFVSTFSNIHDVVLDPFLGSGTTMVACESLGRKCRGIEISPDYCAVILQRMTDAFPGIAISKTT